MDLQYPIGRPDIPETITKAYIDDCIARVEQAPSQLRHAVSGLSEEQLDTPYRPGGWSVRQVVHHLADTHINTYLNFRHALTDDNAVMRPTDINQWANLDDSIHGDINLSLNLFESLQQRWAVLLKGLSLSELEKTILHPSGESRPLWRLLGVYAWHGQHHTAHITGLRDRAGWH